jgi:hypothetical protein
MKRDFILSEAQAMVPLVRHILADLTRVYSSVHRMRRIMRTLDGCQRSSNYQCRRQIHQARAELAASERELHSVTEELEDLGVAILDPIRGMVGFPFFWSPSVGSKRVRRAMFLLKLCDDPAKGICQWRFLGESTEHAVPNHWSQERQAVTSKGEVTTSET